MEERLIVVGKNSYVGRCFTEFAASQCEGLIALGSQDCDFLVTDEVVDFFSGLEDVSHTVVFFAVINTNIDYGRIARCNTGCTIYGGNV